MTSTQGEGTVEVTFRDNLGIVTMKRGENRLKTDMLSQLNAALDQVLRNPDAKALITTGSGKFFSNGIDLVWFAESEKKDPEFTRILDGDIRALYFRILTFPLPTIALVNGHAYAGGAMMSLCHDHVIMQNFRGYWCVNEIHLNMRFPPYMLTLLQNKLPNGRTIQEVVTLGRRFTGDEAKAAGIVQESCAPDQMYSKALEWANKVVPANGFNRDHLTIMKRDVHNVILESSRM